MMMVLERCLQDTYHNIQASVAVKGCMFQSFKDRNISILQLSILSNKSNFHFIQSTLLSEKQQEKH